MSVTVTPIAGDHFAIDVRGHRIEVDQPVAAGGSDAAPTATELFVASLAGCAAFFVGRFLRRHGVDDREWSVRCGYHWSEDRPSRVTIVEVELLLPGGLSDEVRNGALRAADRCTVRDSVRSGLDVRTSVREAAPVA